MQMVLPNGFTALMVAAQHGHAEVIAALLAATPNSQQLAQMVLPNGATSLIIAARRGHRQAITALLHGVADANALALQVDIAGNSALRMAIANNQREAAFALVQAVENPLPMLSQRGADQLTALQFATQSGFSGLRQAAGLEEIGRS